jgi:formylglycine-generating enzyme required for sulfatase activity
MKPIKHLSTGLVIVLSLFISMSTTHAADYTDPFLGIEFMKIKGGTFVMGDILSKNKDATPPHKVAVNDFYMAKHEVTFDQYDAFCDATGREKPSDQGWDRERRPVINVSWIDAEAFTDWLSKKTGKKVHLPSEAQWEYAARAGTSTPYWWGHKAETGLANCSDCGSVWDKRMTAPIGSFKANPWGIQDMTGNVYEWALDTANENYNGAPATEEPWLSGLENQRIARGGSYSSGVQDLKSYFRDWFSETDTMRNTGFRVAIEDQD